MFWKSTRPIFRRPSRRQIFKYWNGKSYSRIDPLLVEERLEDHEQFRPDVHPRGAAEGDLDSFNICVDAYANAFGVHVFDGTSGLTRGELFGLMSSFDLFMWTLKKSTRGSQMPAQSTDATSPKSSEGTTSVTSGCGKTQCDKNCEDPQMCATESPLPSRSTSAETRSPKNSS